MLAVEAAFARWVQPTEDDDAASGAIMGSLESYVQVVFLGAPVLYRSAVVDEPDRKPDRLVLEGQDLVGRSGRRIDGHAKLLFEFTNERLLRGFVVFDVAAREVPDVRDPLPIRVSMAHQHGVAVAQDRHRTVVQHEVIMPPGSCTTAL